jgi:hypothetical protein
MLHLSMCPSESGLLAQDFALVFQRDYEYLESGYGSFEGAATVLPLLRGAMPADDFSFVEHATRNLAEDFTGLEQRLSTVVFGADRNELERAHNIGRIPWQQRENQTLSYGSRNGPMSIFCFGLTKRLNEDLPAGF